MASRLRRSAGLALLLAAALPGGTLAAPAPHAAARGAAERVPIPFAVTGTGPSQRSIAVRFTYGGCDSAPRVSAVEAAHSVRVAVTVSRPTGDMVVCPAIARAGRGVAVLATPLRGRRILGWHSGAETGPPAARCRGGVVLPSVLGMALADGRRALTEQGFRPVTAAGGTRVVRQRPAGRTCVAPGSTVRLLAAR